jgi:membrane fusion protein (multidrug efflux system)
MDEKDGPGRPEAASEGRKQMGPVTQDKKKVIWWKRKRVIIPLAILILAAIGTYYYWYTQVRGYASTDDAYVDANDVTISSKILGRVAKLGADEGDTVFQDQLLVSLDDSDLRAQEAQAEASLELARKNATLAQVNLQKAQDDFERASIQYKGNAITREQYDHARQAEEAAGAQYGAAKAQVGAAQAQLNVVKTQLANTEIHCPFRGVVAKRWVMAGDVVQAAQPIFTIYDLQDIWVTTYLEETKVSSVRIGDHVDISVDAYPGKKFKGTVTEISTAAASEFSLIPPNNASGNFTKVTQRIPIKIAFDSLNDADITRPLRAGLSVEIKIDIKGR